MATYDRLTALDASFLHMERLEYPMHVGVLSLLEGKPFFDERGRFRIREVRELVESRLALMPRFRKRLMFVPYDQGRPIWVDDERFDIMYHVRHTALPRPGSWEQLVALTQRVQEPMLDRARPLWELWFVEGLEGDQVAIIQKTHHALIDGVSGVDVATLLLDSSPEYQPPETTDWTPQPPPSGTQLLVDTMRERVTEPAEMVRTIRAALRIPLDMLRSMSTMMTREAIAPPTVINGLTGRHRQLSVVRVPLADVKEIRRGLGGTVNDVVLAGVAGGLHRFFAHRGAPHEGVRLRVMIPVSVRSDDQRGSLGNKVSAMFVSLPIGSLSSEERLAAITEQTKSLKEKQQAISADFLIGMTDFVAPTLMSLASRVVHRQRFVNLIVTNVPGPQFPLYMMGARLLEAIPIVPLTRNLTVVVGILSYDGTLHFGLWADRDAFDDLEVLASGIDDAFAEMKKVGAP